MLKWQVKEEISIKHRRAINTHEKKKKIKSVYRFNLCSINHSTYAFLYGASRLLECVGTEMTPLILKLGDENEIIFYH